MKEELDKQLCEKYPGIFRDRRADMSVTCMCWGFPGDGWYNIIDGLCAVIQNHHENQIRHREYIIKHNAEIAAAQAGDWTEFDKKNAKYIEEHATWVEDARKRLLNAKIEEVPPVPQQPIAAQVKEKFGGLRFYLDGGDDYVHGAIALAETMSYRTCEECGAPGRTRGPGWVLTLCEAHAKTHEKHTDEELDNLIAKREAEEAEETKE